MRKTIKGALFACAALASLAFAGSAFASYAPKLFVVATAGPEASLGATKLVVCLPPPDVPVGTPGRATFGAKLLSATFSASAITEPKASADLRWTSLWTPYTPGKGTPNPAGSVE